MSQIQKYGTPFVIMIRIKRRKKKMNILKHKNILKGLGQQTDLMNTLGGGVSMAQFQVNKRKDRLEVQVLAPGVGPEAMQVLIDQNRLTVMGVLPAHGSSDAKMPLFYQVIEVPFEVDVAQIRARFEAGRLQVTLPYAEGRNPGPRTIAIEE
jgi:HSP20 family protein